MNPDRYPALTAWRQRVRSGVFGEDPAKPSTWVLDSLWREAAGEMAAIEWRAVLLKPLAQPQPGARASFDPGLPF